VHRDIKPANIMVVSGTNIKVGDFGAAFLNTQEQPDAGAELAAIGSPYYMSPEQVRSEELGVHSDMFALGVVLYELFTGKRPFLASPLEELFAKIQREQPAAPSSIRPEVSKEVDRILLQMLGKTPAERYPSWADLALDIARVGRLSVYQQDIADSDKFTALRKVALLERLNDAEIWELVHAGRWQRLPPQKAVVRESEPGTSLFFIATGQVKVIKQGRLLSVLSAGECFGEMAYIKAGALPRQASVESMTDTVLAELVVTCQELAALLLPFLPAAARRIAADRAESKRVHP
jgi:serine/threonine protein kinase